MFVKFPLYQTSLLPENDRTSISLKEYLAGIDVSMGGRVAEELSKPLKSSLVINQTRNILHLPSIWCGECHQWSKLRYQKCDPYRTGYGQSESHLIEIAWTILNLSSCIALGILQTGPYLL